MTREKRKGYTTKEGQAEATKRWLEKDPKNRERRNYLSKRSSARGFIRNKATQEDLLELRDMIDEKLSEKKKEV